MSVVRRLILPLLLLVGCVAAYIVSEQLGSSDTATAAPEAIESLDVPLTSIRRLPEIATDAINALALSDAFPVAPLALTPLSCLTIMIDGVVVHDVRGDVGLVPGYAQLLVTLHAALDTLGPDYRFETAVMAEALPDDDGELAGDLYVVGGGDPVLMSRSYANSFRPALGNRTAVEELADLVVAEGIVRITGGVVGVERRYDTQRVLPGWPPAYVEAGIVGPLSALQIDDGFAERAAANAGVAIPAEEPALHAANIVDNLLEARDIEIVAPPRVVAESDSLPELVPVVSIRSSPLSELAFQTLAVNDASAAEMILKEIGFFDRREGSTQAGGEAVRRVLEEQGVELAVAPRDASGLDAISSLSCRQLAAAIDTIPADHPTLAILPAYDLPGVFDGDLADIELSADLRLVGGVVGDSSGLVARTADGDQRIVIASIVNRAGGPRIVDVRYQREAIASIDRILVSTDPRLIEVAPSEGS